MRRAIAVLIFTLVAACVAAQDARWTVSILPGYQFNTQSYEHAYGYRYRDEIRGTTQRGFAGSVECAFQLSKHFGLHLGYFVANGKYYESYWWDGQYYDSTTAYRAPVSIWEIGPEWCFRPFEGGEFYVQVNVGRTFSSSSASYRTWYNSYWMTQIRDNVWTCGAAGGFRYFFTKNAGLAAQVAYHRLNGWETPEIWDVRAGLAFRF